MKRIYRFINIFCLGFFFSLFMEPSVLAVDIQLPKYFTIPVNEILDLTSYERELNINKGKTTGFHNSLTWDMPDKISDTEFRSDVPGWYKGCIKESLSTDKQLQCLPIIVTDEAHQIVSVGNKDMYIEGSLSQIPSGLSLEAVTDYVNDSIKFYEIDMLNDGNIQQDAVSSDRVNVILEDDDTVSVLIDNSRVLQSEFNQEVQIPDDLKPGDSWKQLENVEEFIFALENPLLSSMKIETNRDTYVVQPTYILLNTGKGEQNYVQLHDHYLNKKIRLEHWNSSGIQNGKMFENIRIEPQMVTNNDFIMPFYNSTFYSDDGYPFDEHDLKEFQFRVPNVLDASGDIFFFMEEENDELEVYDLSDPTYWRDDNQDVLLWKYHDPSMSVPTGSSVYKPFTIQKNSNEYKFGLQMTILYDEHTGYFNISHKLYNLNDKSLKIGLMGVSRQEARRKQVYKGTVDLFLETEIIEDPVGDGYIGFSRKLKYTLWNKLPLPSSMYVSASFYRQLFDDTVDVGWTLNTINTDSLYGNSYKGPIPTYEELQEGYAFSGEKRPEKITFETERTRQPIISYASQLRDVDSRDYTSIATQIYIGPEAVNPSLKVTITDTNHKEILFYDNEIDSNNFDEKNPKIIFQTDGFGLTEFPSLFRKQNDENNYQKTEYSGQTITYQFKKDDYPVPLAEPGIANKTYDFQTRTADKPYRFSEEVTIPINIYTFGADVLGSFQTKDPSASISVEKVKPLLKPYYIADRGELNYRWVEASQDTCSTESNYLKPSSSTMLKLDPNNVVIDNTYYGCLEMKQEESNKQYYISFPIKVVKVEEELPDSELRFVNKSIQIREDWQILGTSVQDKLILEASQPYVLNNNKNTIEASYPSEKSRFSVKNRSEHAAEICYKHELCDSIMINKTAQKIMWNGMQGSYDSKDHILTLNAGKMNFNLDNNTDLTNFWANQKIEVINNGDNEIIDEEEISKSDINKVIFDSEIKMESTQDMIYLIGMFAREPLEGASYCSEESKNDNYFCNLKEIEGLDKLKSNRPVNIAGMFTGNTSIDKLDLSQFQPKIQSSDQYGAFEGTFKNMSGLTEVIIPMSNADKEPKEPLENTFSGDDLLEKIVILSKNEEDMEINFEPSGLGNQERTTAPDDFRKNSGWINNHLEKAYTKGIGEVSLPSKKSLEFIWQPQGNNITVDVKDFDGIYNQPESFTKIGQYDYKQINIPNDREITEIKREDKIITPGKEGKLIYQKDNHLYIQSNELYTEHQNITYEVNLQADKPIQLSISVPETMSFVINEVGTKEDRPISSPDPWKLKVQTNIPSNQWKIKITQTEDLANRKSQVICEGNSSCFVYRDKSGANHDLFKGQSVILNSSEFELDQKDKLDWTTEWGEKTKHNYGLFFNPSNIPFDIKIGTYKTEFLFSMETSI